MIVFVIAQPYFFLACIIFWLYRDLSKIPIEVRDHTVQQKVGLGGKSEHAPASLSVKITHCGM